MRLIEIKLDVDTITRTGETFDANLVVGFTVINKGASDCTLHYQGGPALLKVGKGNHVSLTVIQVSCGLNACRLNS